MMSAAAHAQTIATTITVGSNPIGLAYDPNMHEVFVVNSVSGNIQVISDSTNTVVASITALTQYAGAPYNIAYDSGKGEMWVTDATGAYAISDATNTIVANVTTADLMGIAYDSAKGEVFVANGVTGPISVISDSTNTIVANITATATGLAYDSTKGEIFASVFNTVGVLADVDVISDSTNAIVATIPFSVGANNGILSYDPAKGEIFVSSVYSGSTVTVISDSSNKIEATINTGLPSNPGAVGSGIYAQNIAYDSGKGEIWVTGVNEAVAISDSTNKVVGTVNTGFSAPGSIAYDSGTSEIYAANSNIPGSVAVISDASSGTSTSTATTSPTTSTAATSTPKVPEFSNAAFTFITVAIAATTLSAVALARKRTFAK